MLGDSFNESGGRGRGAKSESGTRLRPTRAGDGAFREQLRELRWASRADVIIALRQDAAGRPVSWLVLGAELDAAMFALQQSPIAQPLGLPENERSLSCPHRIWSERFVSPLDEASLDEVLATPFGREVWERLGVLDQLVLLAESADMHAGSVLVLRTGGRRFGRADRRRVQSWVEPMRRALGRRLQTERASAPKDALRLVLDADTHEVRAVTEGSTAWLERPAGRALLAQLPTLLGADGSPASAGAETERFFRGLSIRTHPMQGKEGASLLVTIEDAEPLTLAPDACLTDLQRQIAEQALHGATASEIAASLGRSPTTVRSHLKEIYRRLEVNSRAELALKLASG